MNRSSTPDFLRFPSRRRLLGRANFVTSSDGMCRGAIESSQVMHPKTRRSLGKSGELLSYISIMYVGLSASMYTNPELLASERPFSHPPSIRKQHPEAFTVAPANTGNGSKLPTRESKREHDESTSTTRSSEAKCTDTFFLFGGC